MQLNSPNKTSNEPWLSALTEDTFRVFVYLQREQSYHNANKGNFRPPHSKRKLQTCFNWRIVSKIETPPKSTCTFWNQNQKKVDTKQEMDHHTGCIFTYVTTGNFTGIRKTNTHMAASKFVTHVDLQQTQSNKLPLHSFKCQHAISRQLEQLQSSKPRKTTSSSQHYTLHHFRTLNQSCNKFRGNYRNWKSRWHQIPPSSLHKVLKLHELDSIWHITSRLHKYGVWTHHYHQWSPKPYP